MGPIPLTWADPELQTNQIKDDAADEAANADNRMVRRRPAKHRDLHPMPWGVRRNIGRMTRPDQALAFPDPAALFRQGVEVGSGGRDQGALHSVRGCPQH